MPDAVRRALDQARKFWNNLPRTSRGVFLAVVAGILLVTSLLTYLSVRPQFHPLFTNLSPEDAGQVVQKLKEQGVPYRLSEDGRSVLVPRQQVHELRLSMAAEGLPQGGGVGFELFDKTTWNITEFTQRVNYLRALQTELQRTINQLKPVEASRVHIVLPEKELFEEDQEEPTASVVLRLKPYASLKKNQVKAIVHLVSRSVEGLKTENVEVIDTGGNVLSELLRDEGGLPELTEAQTLARKRYEKALEKRVESMLEKVLGKKNVVARVSAELDFARTNVKSETYQPVVGEEGILRSEQATDESFKGRGVAPGGVPGVTSNVPTYPAAPTGESEYKKSDVIRNYEISKIVEEKVNAPGEVKRLSVAVIVDIKALNKIEVNDIRNVAAAAAGINPDRGDRIEVVSMPFSRAEEERRLQELRQARQKILFYWSAGVVMTLILILLFYMMLKPRRREIEEFYPIETIPIRTPEEKRAEEEIGLPELEKVEEPREDEERRRKREVYEHVVRTVSERPKDVAQIIRGWMAEE